MCRMDLTGVFDDLGYDPDTYPHVLTRIHRIHFHLFQVPLPVRTRQYAVRRIEFDHWLLQKPACRCTPMP